LGGEGDEEGLGGGTGEGQNEDGNQRAKKQQVQVSGEISYLEQRFEQLEGRRREGSEDGQHKKERRSDLEQGNEGVARGQEDSELHMYISKGKQRES